ncbi:MAG: glycosyltransferase family 2 protein [Bacteroidetes bacterium]|nr:glycosyltransferase family 2 protein [Bacteroidota bacterium]
MSNKPHQSWSLGIMCYNESGNIEQVVRNTYKTAAQLSGDFEVLVVDDGSADDSVEILKRLQSGDFPQLRILEHGINRGIGAALRSIYFNATKDVVVALPGDGQFDTDELLAYPYVAMRTVISYYRVENTSYSVFRNGLSWANKTLNRLLLGMELRDVNWILVFRTAELKDLDLRMQSSIVTSEICSKLRAKGWRFLEVQSRYLPRTAGKSRGASLKTIYRAARELLKLFLVYRLFRFRLRKTA